MCKFSLDSKILSLSSPSQVLEAGSCALLYHRREYGCCYDPPSESFTGIEGGREGGRQERGVDKGRKRGSKRGSKRRACCRNREEGTEKD